MKKRIISVMLIMLMAIAMGLPAAAEVDSNKMPIEFDEEVNNILSIITPSMSDIACRCDF